MTMQNSNSTMRGALLAALLIPLSVFADENTESVDAVFAEFTQPGSPGAAVAIMRDGEMLYEQGYGLAQLEYDIPITSESIFHVASVSKQFAAFAVLLLANEGKLSLDDDIRKHLDEVPEFDHTITIRHLIHHTSGLRDQWALLTAAGWRMEDVITVPDILKLVSMQEELNYPPGDAHLYCNTGFTLLGVIVDRVTGKSLNAFCTERIFEPLGMTRTHFHDDHQHIVPNRTYSYARLGEDGFEKRVLSYANAGATSLFTTPGDLLRWQRNFESGEIGGADAIEMMQTRGKLNDGREITYAFGIGHGDYRGMKILSHGGADAGFRSHLIWFPEQRLSVAVTSNLANANAGRLALNVADVYLPEESDAESPEPPSPEKNEAWGKYKGTYLNEDIGQVLKLSHKDGVLKLVAGLNTPIPLTPESGTSFRPVANPDSLLVELDLDRKNEVRAMHLTTPTAVRRTYVPVERPKRTPEYLAEIVGRYYSPELDVTYDVTLDGRTLMMESRKQEPTALQPQFLDGFAWDGSVVRFERNSRGKPARFRINSGRILNLRFEKVE